MSEIKPQRQKKKRRRKGREEEERRTKKGFAYEQASQSVFSPPSPLPSPLPPPPPQRSSSQPVCLSLPPLPAQVNGPLGEKTKKEEGDRRKEPARKSLNLCYILKCICENKSRSTVTLAELKKKKKVYVCVQCGRRGRVVPHGDMSV